MPFDIPENWRWVYIGNIATKITDGTHKTPHYTENGIRFVSAKDIVTGNLSFENCKFISPEEHAQLFSRCNPEKGDVLISKSGSIGTVVLNNYSYPFSLFESLALVKYDQENVYGQYLKYAIRNAFSYLNRDNIRGVAVKHLPLESIINMRIPLPPLAEQKRIVAKLEQLLPLCAGLKRDN